MLPLPPLDGGNAEIIKRLHLAVESLKGASPDEAERRIEALETELKTLRLRLQPRQLPAAQRQAMMDRSRLPAGARPYELTGVYERDCSDCKRFAADLASRLDAPEAGSRSSSASKSAATSMRGSLPYCCSRLRRQKALRPTNWALQNATCRLVVVGNCSPPLRRFDSAVRH
jgi:hypothetical protein